MESKIAVPDPKSAPNGFPRVEMLIWVLWLRRGSRGRDLSIRLHRKAQEDIRECANAIWRRPTMPVRLASDTVHIWRADLSTYGAEVASCLSPDEWERANRFQFDRDRTMYSLSRGLLRRLIASYLDREPASICFEYSHRGRPSLATPETLSFNVSHSHGKAVYAFGREAEVGVDVERCDQGVNAAELAKRFFTPGELRFVTSGESSRVSERFYFLWCRKEAYAKALGEGLHLPLDSFDVAGDNDLDGFEVRSFTPFEGFAGAFAIRPYAANVEFFDCALMTHSSASVSE